MPTLINGLMYWKSPNDFVLVVRVTRDSPDELGFLFLQNQINLPGSVE
jgi:hypothetical protein